MRILGMERKVYHKPHFGATIAYEATLYCTINMSVVNPESSHKRTPS